MKREEILKTLKQAEAALCAEGVTHAALFGSVARGDNGPDSDIDIMVEIDPAAEISLIGYVGIVQMIEELFPVPVDVASREGLKPLARPISSATRSMFSDAAISRFSTFATTSCLRGSSPPA